MRSGRAHGLAFLLRRADSRAGTAALLHARRHCMLARTPHVCATRVQQWRRVAGCARVSHLWAAKAAKRAEWPLSRLGRLALAPTRRAAASLLVEISSQGKCCASMNVVESECCVCVQQAHV